MRKETEDFAALAAWNVETIDISARVSAAIGDAAPGAELLHEMRLMRQEMEELRRNVAVLRQEIARSRPEPVSRLTTRLAPYAPTESLIRLS